MKQLVQILGLILIVSCNSDDTKNGDYALETESNKALVSENTLKDTSLETESAIEINNPERKKLIDEHEALLDLFPELSDYIVYEYTEPFAVRGDFFGDDTSDIALLVKTYPEVKLCIINFAADSTVYILGDGNKYDFEKKKSNYNWVGIFKKVDQGDTLWSNYEDDFRSLEDVPENEKVVLTYDAIYAHAPESCGGAFIFWKDGKFNWLQQE